VHLLPPSERDVERVAMANMAKQASDLQSGKDTIEAFGRPSSSAKGKKLRTRPRRLRRDS
jgi:hypothetical protein